MNIFYANIDVYSRIFIADLPGDGVKCIKKLQSHWANIYFSDKSMYARSFKQVPHKGGESAMNYIKDSRIHRFCQFQQETLTQRINQCIYFRITFTKVENILLK